MKIMFIITGLGMGGAEKQVVKLADLFDSDGHDVKLVYFLEPAIVKPSRDGVEVISLGVHKSIWGLFQIFYKLLSLIRSIRPDVVHSHMGHANIVTRLCRIFVRVPRLVTTAHTPNDGGRFRALAYRLTNSLSDVVTNVSEDAVRAFEDKGYAPKGAMICVPNGIDTDQFCFDAESRFSIRKELGCKDEKIIIAVGRMFSVKNYPNLIRAFKKLSVIHSNVSLFIVGEGPEKERLLELVESLQLSERVRLLGIRHDIPQLLSASDIFAMSSDWEGFPLSIGEAMSVERVVVSTNCGGPSEMLGGCGYIVPIKDDEALSAALTSAIQLSEEAAIEIGRQVRRRVVEEYSISAIAKKWMEIYKG
jgi:glycosyltransferase involved in cell wall biosynthesis